MPMSLKLSHRVWKYSCNENGKTGKLLFQGNRTLTWSCFCQLLGVLYVLAGESTSMGGCTPAVLSRVELNLLLPSTPCCSPASFRNESAIWSKVRDFLCWLLLLGSWVLSFPLGWWQDKEGLAWPLGWLSPACHCCALRFLHTGWGSCAFCAMFAWFRSANCILISLLFVSVLSVCVLLFPHFVGKTAR